MEHPCHIPQRATGSSLTQLGCRFEQGTHPTGPIKSSCQAMTTGDHWWTWGLEESGFWFGCRSLKDYISQCQFLQRSLVWGLGRRFFSIRPVPTIFVLQRPSCPLNQYLGIGGDSAPRTHLSPDQLLSTGNGPSSEGSGEKPPDLRNYDPWFGTLNWIDDHDNQIL